MTANVGLEHSFLASWQGWDEVGNAGDLCFYQCKLANHIKGIEPEGTEEICMTFLMSVSTVQFDFYGARPDGETSGEYLGSKVFNIKAVLEEEIPCDE